MRKTKSQAIYEDLLQKIKSGEWVAGQQLPTEKQFAKSYGVAVLTVRHALARLRAEGLIVSRRYHGTSVAQGEKAPAVKTSPSRILGLLVAKSLAQLSNPVFSRLVDGIEGILAETGYTLEVVVANDPDPVADERFDRLVSESKCAGWLIPIKLSDFQKNVLKNRPEPKVLLHFADDSLSGHLFETDLLMLSFNVIDHLHQRGYKNIWILGPPNVTAWSEAMMRFSGSRIAPEGMTLRAVEVADFQSSLAREACGKILESHRADAFICADDELCLGALQALQDRNLSSPEVGLIGGGDFPVSLLVKPSLTTISYPYYQVGREATNLLMELIAGELIEPVHRKFVPKLIARESTARPLASSIRQWPPFRVL